MMRLSFKETENSPLQPAGQPLRNRAGRAREAEESEHSGAATPSRLLEECRRTLVRHRRLILMWAAAGVIAGVVLQFPIQPVYRAVVSIEVQLPNSAMDPVGTSAATGNLETQTKLLQGDETLARVEERLIDDPYATPVEKRDWLSRLRRTLQLGGKQAIPLSSLIDQSAKSVRAWRPGSTQMIGASCDSWSPAFAAKYCNLLTGELQREDVESRGAMATQTSALLMQQAATIQAKSTDAQRRLQSLHGQDHPASPRNGADRDRLRQLEAELIKAQADRMTRQAQIKAAQEAGSEITPDTVDSKAYALSEARLAELERRLKVMSSQANAHDKKLGRLRAEITHIETGLSEKRAAGLQRLQAQYDAAKHREDLLRLSYQALEAKQPPDTLQDSQADQLRREVANDRQLYQALLERAREAGFNSATQTSLVRVVEQAKSPQSAIYPHRLGLVAVGLTVGSLAGLGLAFFKDSNRSVLRLPGESEILLGVEELGVIPSPAKDPLFPARRHALALARSQARSQSQALRTARWDEEFSLVAEAYRNAMLSITLAKPEGEGKVYIVSSPGAGEGKSTVTTNLGVALSKSNLRVILVDGDLRRPSLHDILSVPNGLGLRNILRGEVNLGDSSVSLYCKSTIFPNLAVIPAGGRGQVRDLLHTIRFRALLERLLHDFDIILVDTPPMLHIPDARILAQKTNGAILVFRSGVTSREDAVSAGKVLQQDRVPILGTILNDFNPANEGRHGYYKSYYAYQQQTAPKDPATNS